jgi:cellulose synthase/poly-beta-1,6-N-acetylglucosamine synthase-like glycosyltransferase/peptidoglycan/xylan/chitin deacetylase (PgdA/CDA1 family)/spore germination protein YaaH
VATPVFFDATGKRRRAVNRASTVLGLAAAVLTTIFVVSLLVVPFLPQLPGMVNPARRLSHAGQSLLPRREQRLGRRLLLHERNALWREIAAPRRPRPAARRIPVAPPRPDTVVAAFYVTWQKSGLSSLRANADRLTDLYPEWLHLNRAGTALDFHDWDPEVTPANRDVADVARAHHIDVSPVLNNAEGGQFDPRRAHVLLASPVKQHLVAQAIRDWLVEQHFQGLNLDLENLYPGDYARLPGFIARLRDAFGPAGLRLSVDVEAGKRQVPLAAVAGGADYVIVMAYNEHYAGGAPGPLAGAGWYDSVLTRTLAQVPAAKLVAGIANFALDWPANGKPASALTYQGALIAARDNHPDEPPKQVVDFDPQALNPTFDYEDDSSHAHEVWMLDGVTAYNDLVLAHRLGVRGAALWVLGSEDPSLWDVYDRHLVDALPSPAVLDTIPSPSGIEFQGDGEILEVATSPQRGLRTTDRDSTTGLVTDEQYDEFPTSYLIRRSGYRKGVLALTFDDGPDRVFTPEILDVLRRFGVHATFFLIGENVERYPEVTRRILRDGNEIGSHTFTHPNMAAVSRRRALLELNTTQRALQSVLGRSTILFRFPYDADAEPTSAEEARPIVLADSLGYATVGELIDPEDWNLYKTDSAGNRQRRTAGDLVATVLRQVQATPRANVILMHSAGGDRSQTVLALEKLIPLLENEGYRFVTVSQLLGVPADVVMPPIGRKDQLLVGLDRISFNAVFLFETVLGLTFLFAVVLAVGRVAFIIPVALAARRKARREQFDPAYHPAVSVLIAAYNEQRVIANTVRSVLANPYAGLEVIVVDDGSTDGTGDEVERQFADEPRVRLLRQANAGKAAALNRGLAAAAGEILVCFDADTQIAPDGIGLIVRHFADARVGAVAGNVKVGNRLNLLTRWQSIEYITSQNLDRRAYGHLNAITVVPGAVGAWRKSAVLAVGGYLTDTMAEDMELTYRIRRAGWRIAADVETLGYTEAPATFRTFFRQRFRWAYGTLQCLWKHRGATFHNGWFGWVAIPAVWVFQVIFQAIGPLVDLKVLWTVVDFVYSWATMGALHQDWQPLPQITRVVLEVGFFYGIFFGVDLIGAFIAYRLDREDLRDLWWLFWQRFVYRQLMYAVLIKSVVTAMKGKRQGWGKQERHGTVQLQDVSA